MGIAADYYSIEGEFLEKFSDEYRFGPNLPSWAGGSLGGGVYQFLFCSARAFSSGHSIYIRYKIKKR